MPARWCACGCGRDITHKREDAKTFGASCRQRIARAAQRTTSNPLEPRSCQCDSGFFYRDAEGDAVCGLCGCWIARVAASLISEDYQLAEAVLRSNGTFLPFRPIARKWFDTQQEYRRRETARS